MNAPVTELKTRARLLLNALESVQPEAAARAQRISKKRRWPVPEAWQLRHCLNIVAAEAGFTHWDHARVVLGGEAHPGDDMGDFWCEAESAVFLNHWFADYRLALECLQGESRRFLLPYRRQFVVTGEHYLRHIGLDPDEVAWTEIGRNLVTGYASAAWLRLSEQRLHARRPVMTPVGSSHGQA
ncbi:hypothetical protein [Undibacterium sp.]|jgi:hypothetical protein|uniref:hypothetical protein n=1 Tax=Undibacterium sp. TaxID=1914977 RepID=UPI002C6B4D11|nr:hypothetical protein [Undibacterium sp.]HTD03437.1 hypothetical protein [Undibacterium sp.]